MIQSFSGKSNASAGNRGAGDITDMTKRIDDLEESLKKENKNTAKQKEIVRELKEKFFPRNEVSRILHSTYHIKALLYRLYNNLYSIGYTV